MGLSSAITTLASQARGELLSSINKQDGDQEVEDQITSRRTNGTKVLTGKDETTHLLANFDAEKGDGKEEEILLPLVILYRGIFIQLLFVVPVGIWWISGIRECLIALGQDSTISDLTTVSMDQR